ncbi:MAG TPA: hypothetical protein VGN57_04020 [Pirellulaceae bacterium]|jgi:hypothetical protein|nr:hypothetical protein [Pirellulaceae bacterium]
MRHSDLQRAVARVTGESLASIRRRGFSLLGATEPEEFDGESCDFDPGAGPIDWDALDAQRALPSWGSFSPSAG